MKIDWLCCECNSCNTSFDELELLCHEGNCNHQLCEDCYHPQEQTSEDHSNSALVTYYASEMQSYGNDDYNCVTRTYEEPTYYATQSYEEALAYHDSSEEIYTEPVYYYQTDQTFEEPTYSNHSSELVTQRYEEPSSCSTDLITHVYQQPTFYANELQVYGGEDYNGVTHTYEEPSSSTSRAVYFEHNFQVHQANAWKAKYMKVAHKLSGNYVKNTKIGGKFLKFWRRLRRKKPKV